MKEPINSDTVDASDQSDVKTSDTNVKGGRHETVEKPNAISGGAKEVRPKNNASNTKLKYAELKTNFTCDQCDAKFVYQNTYDIHVQEHLNMV